MTDFSAGPIAAEPVSLKSRASRTTKTTVALIAGVSVIVGLLIGLILGRLRTQAPQLKLSFFKAGENVESINSVCPLLISSFSDFKTEKDPQAACREYLNYLKPVCQMGLLYEGNELVGFISSYFRPEPTETAHLELYSVCIKPERRNHGLAKTLINLFLIELMKTTKHKTVLIGLDINLTSSHAKEAFALYTKMGFLRWWQPCDNISEFDYSSVETAPNQFPISEWLSSQNELKKRLNGMTHLCMFKKWPSDDFYRFGGALNDAAKQIPIQERK